MFINIVCSNMKAENNFGLIKNIYEFMICILKYIILLAFILYNFTYQSYITTNHILQPNFPRS